MPLRCHSCNASPVMRRPKNGHALCKGCFFETFEREIHETIVKFRLFEKGDYVAIGASGGKDSTVLAYIMKTLNERHDYGLKLVLLSIDEGIKGYRDDSLKTVENNKIQYGLPLKVLSYQELYGWTMDQIVQQVGIKNNCTICGVFRRQALDRGATILGCNKLVTGHNADDAAETVLMNLLRGDITRIERSMDIATGTEVGSTDCEFTMPRAKPFKYMYQKEIVLYAHFKKLEYFSTECTYAPNSFRGHAREFLKDAEAIRPSSIIDIITSGDILIDSVGEVARSRFSEQRKCSKCNYMSSQEVCKACTILEGLNRGLAKLSVGDLKAITIKSI